MVKKQSKTLVRWPMYVFLLLLVIVGGIFWNSLPFTSMSKKEGFANAIRGDIGINGVKRTISDLSKHTPGGCVRSVMVPTSRTMSLKTQCLNEKTGEKKDRVLVINNDSIALNNEDTQELRKQYGKLCEKFGEVPVKFDGCGNGMRVQKIRYETTDNFRRRTKWSSKTRDTPEPIIYADADNDD